MKRWIISVLLAIFLSSPAVSVATIDLLDPGGAKLFNYWLLNIPTGSNPDSKAAREKKEEGGATYDETKEKHDKKVDDAIMNAWKEK
jgi:hypothetical protein